MLKNNNGKNNSFYGKHHSKKTKELLSKINTIPRTKPFIISETMEYIINGLMLGDGCLFQSKKTTARYSHGYKYKEYIDFICKELDIEWGKLYQDKKTNCFHIKSLSSPTWLELKQKWYIDNKKIVPKDIKINGKTLLFWFLGDGFINTPTKYRDKDTKYYEIFLCTDAFNRDDNNFLINKLSDIGIVSTLTSRNRLRISAKSNKRFFELVGECPVECYKYKWRMKK